MEVVALQERRDDQCRFHHGVLVLGSAWLSARSKIGVLWLIGADALVGLLGWV